MYTQGEDVKIDDIIISLPGLVIGFNSTIFPAIEAIRVALGLDTIKFFIETWDDVDNNPWVAGIRREHSNYPNVKLILRQWKHTDIGFDKQWERIYDGLGIKYETPIDVHSNLFKRLVPFVIFQKQYSRIYEYLCTYSHAQYLFGYRNIPIVRIKPNFIFHKPEEIIEKFSIHLNRDLSQHFIQFNPIAFSNVKSPFDILYTEHITSHSVSDIFFYSSIDILYRTFGTTTEETVDKFTELTAKYFARLPYKITTPEDFGTLSLNQEYYSLEASVLFKDFLDLNPLPVNYGSNNFLRSALFRKHIEMKNPRYSIKKGEVVKEVETVIKHIETTDCKLVTNIDKSVTVL